ncbi:MAG: hypothetical protein ABIW82_16965 [Dokdonella sp.]
MSSFDSPLALQLAQRMLSSAVQCVRAQGREQLLKDQDFLRRLVGALQDVSMACIDEVVHDAGEAITCGMHRVAVATALASATRFGSQCAMSSMAAVTVIPSTALLR